MAGGPGGGEIGGRQQELPRIGAVGRVEIVPEGRRARRVARERERGRRRGSGRGAGRGQVRQRFGECPRVTLDDGGGEPSQRGTRHPPRQRPVARAARRASPVGRQVHLGEGAVVGGHRLAHQVHPQRLAEIGVERHGQETGARVDVRRRHPQPEGHGVVGALGVDEQTDGRRRVFRATDDPERVEKERASGAPRGSSAAGEPG